MNIVDVIEEEEQEEEQEQEEEKEIENLHITKEIGQERVIS